ncbi:uncharacterized protein LOC6042967 [Culex quinquefasciatus]|uniref:uncharacterized protein LOC6042967 n=1 Tax=Culex quinquefasciatus TaxID=7176 RepID=UPI0018E2F1B3|nr:uncharacterized protein LOC6042967 [Culex quinquefasciatus]
MAVKTATCFLLLAAVASVELIQVMFDQFKHCKSNGILNCNLRVHKINRTVASLYGTATFRVDLGESFVTSCDVFHSPLGNNQYNLYPLKIPQVSVCTYLEKYWEDYYPYIVGAVPSAPKPGECPVSARELHFNELIMDARMFSPYMPTGLWKLVWRASDTNTDKRFEVELTFRVYPDGHF